ncbi:MAG: RidA family protein [Desulfuromonadaceae bacterium]|nr:RidA family protein [Desulfuromonadaceae bacterium]
MPTLHRKTINTRQAPAAIGPYSQAVQMGNQLFISGQLGLDPAAGTMVPGGVVAETRQALANLRAILEEASFTLKDVVQVQVFLADIDDFAAMNEVYATFFTENPPARAAFQVAALPKNGRVEITAQAIRIATP